MKPAHGIIFVNGVQHSVGSFGSGGGSEQGRKGMRGRPGMQGISNAADGWREGETTATATSKVIRRHLLDGTILDAEEFVWLLAYAIEGEELPYL